LKYPRDIGYATLVHQLDSGVAGIDDRAEVLGATVVDVLNAHVARNEYGASQRVSLTLIPGRWVQDKSVQKQ
jgi:hypothetical protein